MKVSIFCFSFFACKDFSSFHGTKSPELSEGLVSISRTWPVPTPGCVFGKVGGGSAPTHPPTHRTPPIFPAHWLPKSVKNVLGTCSFHFDTRRGCLSSPCSHSWWIGVCVVSSLPPIPRLSQAEGKRGMLFNHCPSPQARALLVVKDTKASSLGPSLARRQRRWRRRGGVGGWFQDSSPCASPLAPLVVVSCSSIFFFLSLVGGAENKKYSGK